MPVLYWVTDILGTENIFFSPVGVSQLINPMLKVWLLIYEAEIWGEGVKSNLKILQNKLMRQVLGSLVAQKEFLWFSFADLPMWRTQSLWDLYQAVAPDWLPTNHLIFPNLSYYGLVGMVQLEFTVWVPQPKKPCSSFCLEQEGNSAVKAYFSCHKKMRKRGEKEDFE